MSIYTVVDECYCVDVYHSLKSVSNAFNGQELCLSEAGDEDIPLAHPNDIAKALCKESIIRLYEPGCIDWKYKIEKQP